MRAYKRLGKEGFTLVELMIVVAIIGVLAALAIYGVRRYLATAKTSEAKNTVGAISRSAVASYERETVGAELLGDAANSTGSSNSLCTSATPVPAAPPTGTKYQPSTAAGADFDSGSATAGWRCLKFSLTQPIYYQYQYNQGAGYVAANNPALPDNTGFEALAAGDLDGDASPSYFARTGNIRNGQVVLATQIYIENEFE